MRQGHSELARLLPRDCLAVRRGMVDADLLEESVRTFATADDNDRAIKFFIPGGASSQWLIGSDEHLDAPLDMDFVQQTIGVMLGYLDFRFPDDGWRRRQPRLAAWYAAIEERPSMRLTGPPAA